MNLYSISTELEIEVNRFSFKKVSRCLLLDLAEETVMFNRTLQMELQKTACMA